MECFYFSCVISRKKSVKKNLFILFQQVLEHSPPVDNVAGLAVIKIECLFPLVYPSGQILTCTTDASGYNIKWPYTSYVSFILRFLRVFLYKASFIILR